MQSGYEPYIGENIMNYKVVDFIRYYYGILAFRVEHLVNHHTYLMKIVHCPTSEFEIVVMMVNEIRILSSISHPLFYEYVESFVELEKGLMCAVYQYEKSMNLNEIMFRLSYNGENIIQDNMVSYLVHSALIGKELEKYRIEMLEMDPKNLFQNSNMEIKLGCCLKFFTPAIKLRDLEAISCDNVTAPEIIVSKQYSIRTNVWHFGYVAYLISSLKFNFQRIKTSDLKKLSPNFFKVLEKSKIRTIYEGPIFQTIWNMMQPEPETRSSWDEILQTPEFQPALDKIESRYPGIVERSNSKERMPLKPMIDVTKELFEINSALFKTYGQNYTKQGVPKDPPAYLIQHQFIPPQTTPRMPQEDDPEP